jgi:hypothetical protein
MGGNPTKSELENLHRLLHAAREEDLGAGVGLFYFSGTCLWLLFPFVANRAVVGAGITGDR